MARTDFTTPRLFVDDPLGPDARIALDAARTNYVKNVMRLAEGATVLVFNGRDGEWRARVASIARKETTLGVLNDQYTKLCKEAKLRGLTVGEFSGVCTVLADQTLLKLGAGREDRQRKVSLGVHNDDVVFALQGVNFFRNLIGELNRGV